MKALDPGPTPRSLDGYGPAVRKMQIKRAKGDDVEEKMPERRHSRTDLVVVGVATRFGSVMVIRAVKGLNQTNAMWHQVCAPSCHQPVGYLKRCKRRQLPGAAEETQVGGVSCVDLQAIDSTRNHPIEMALKKKSEAKKSQEGSEESGAVTQSISTMTLDEYFQSKEKLPPEKRKEWDHVMRKEDDGAMVMENNASTPLPSLSLTPTHLSSPVSITVSASIKLPVAALTETLHPEPASSGDCKASESKDLNPPDTKLVYETKQLDDDAAVAVAHSDAKVIEAKNDEDGKPVQEQDEDKEHASKEHRQSEEDKQVESVVGLTLSEYLKVNSEDTPSVEHHQHHHPSHHAQQQQTQQHNEQFESETPTKDPLANAESPLSLKSLDKKKQQHHQAFVHGMSLDDYLGAVEGKGDVEYPMYAESKSPGKKKKGKFKIKKLPKDFSPDDAEYSKSTSALPSDMSLIKLPANHKKTRHLNGDSGAMYPKISNSNSTNSIGFSKQLFPRDQQAVLEAHHYKKKKNKNESPQKKPPLPVLHKGFANSNSAANPASSVTTTNGSNAGAVTFCSWDPAFAKEFFDDKLPLLPHK